MPALEKKKPGPKPGKSQGVTLLREVTRLAKLDYARLSATAFPLTIYQQEPVRFVKEFLGEEPLPHQAEIMNAIAFNEKVAVRSGQKIGKTKLVIWIALWAFCCFPDVRVIMTAAIKEQIQRVLWKELQGTVALAKRRGKELETPARAPATGMISSDGVLRQILGFTARDKEALAGISGPKMIFIVDEASALSQEFAEAFEGNMAGGNCKLVMISNPTRTEGPFFDAFHTKKAAWVTFTISSEKVARWCADNGKKVPGIADIRRIEQWKEEYGDDSVFYRIRVKGDFILNESGKIITVDTLSQAQARYDDVESEGRLSIGIDPAGPGDGGDATVFSIVRGKKQLGLHAFHGLTEEAIQAHFESFIKTYREGDEIPLAVVDADGPIGYSLIAKMKLRGEYLRRTKPSESYEAWGVKASGEARRSPVIYERTRDELWANAAEWLKTGALLPDYQQEAELHAPNFESTISGKLKVTAKTKLREDLGRSPDRADAFCLSVWNPSPWLNEENVGVVLLPPEQVGIREDEREFDDIDPYGRDFIDPYG